MRKQRIIVKHVRGLLFFPNLLIDSLRHDVSYLKKTVSKLATKHRPAKLWWGLGLVDKLPHTRNPRNWQRTRCALCSLSRDTPEHYWVCPATRHLWDPHNERVTQLLRDIANENGLLYTPAKALACIPINMRQWGADAPWSFAFGALPEAKRPRLTSQRRELAVKAITTLAPVACEIFKLRCKLLRRTY